MFILQLEPEIENTFPIDLNVFWTLLSNSWQKGEKVSRNANLFF